MLRLLSMAMGLRDGDRVRASGELLEDHAVRRRDTGTVLLASGPFGDVIVRWDYFGVEHNRREHLERVGETETT